MEWKVFSLDGLRAREKEGPWHAVYLLSEMEVRDFYQASHWLVTGDPDQLDSSWERLSLSEVLERIPASFHQWAISLQKARSSMYALQGAAGVKVSEELERQLLAVI
jgi:hypothetical protein